MIFIRDLQPFTAQVLAQLRTSLLGPVLGSPICSKLKSSDLIRIQQSFWKNQSSHSSRITHPVGLRPSTHVNPAGTFWGNHNVKTWQRHPLPTRPWSLVAVVCLQRGDLKANNQNSHVGQQPGGLHPNLRLWRVALALVTASTKLWPLKRPANVSFRMENRKKHPARSFKNPTPIARGQAKVWSIPRELGPTKTCLVYLFFLFYKLGNLFPTSPANQITIQNIWFHCYHGYQLHFPRVQGSRRYFRSTLGEGPLLSCLLWITTMCNPWHMLTYLLTWVTSSISHGAT